MPDLAQLQTELVQSLLSGRFGALETDVLIGPITAAEAFSVHRNTALGGLVNALRLTCPTVHALVGAAFFDQAALAFIEDAPPASAWLTGYGAGFAGFLAAYAFAADLPYLADVARLDAAIEAAGCAAVGRDGLELDLGEALLTLDASLRVLSLRYPAAAIRDAIEAGDDAALAAIDLTPASHALALWRRPDGAATRPLGRLPAAFLAAIVDGCDIEAVLATAQPDDLAALQSDVFAAPFARIIAKPKENAP